MKLFKTTVKYAKAFSQGSSFLGKEEYTEALESNHLTSTSKELVEKNIQKEDEKYHQAIATKISDLKEYTDVKISDFSLKEDETAKQLTETTEYTDYLQYRK